MSLININDLIQQYALRSGILDGQGNMTQPQQNTQPQGLLNSPAFGQALLRAAAGIAAADQGGYGLGGALAIGANAFSDTMATEKDRLEKAQKDATRDQLAALKDIIGLKTQQEELALRMQSASLARRARQDALDEKAQEKAAQEARRQAIYASGDQNLIKAYEMFGDDAAQGVYMAAQKPQDRKMVEQGGVQYYADTGEPVLPNAPAATKQTDTYRKENDLAKEALNALKDYEGALYDKNGTINRSAVNFGEWTTEGRDLYQPLRTAVANNIYLKTGAAATPGEIEAQMKQYQPSMFDTKEQIERKAASLKQFLTSKAPDFVPTGNAKKPDATSGFKYMGVE